MKPFNRRYALTFEVPDFPNWKFTLNSVLFTLLFSVCIFQQAVAQEYIQAAGVIGSNLSDATSDYIVENDTIYIAGTTNGNFPTTNGTSYSGGQQDLVFVKYEGTTLNLLTATVNGGTGSETPFSIKKIGDKLYLFGSANGPGLPASNGHAGSTDAFIVQMDLNGNILNARYYGGSDSDQIGDVKVVNGIAHIAMQTRSFNFPTTNGSTSNGLNDIVYLMVELSTLNLSFSSYFGGSGDENTPTLDVDGNLTAIMFSTSSTNLPVTNGSTLSGQTDIGVYTVNATNGALLNAAYLGGSNSERTDQILINQGEVFVTGNTGSTDFPNTSGAPMPSATNMFFTRFSNNLTIISSTFITSGFALFSNLTYYNHSFYLTSHDLSFTTNGAGIYILKLDRNGNVIWNYQGIQSGSKYADLIVDQGKVFVTTNSIIPGLITTNGSYYSGDFDIYHTILDTSGVLKFAGYYGGPESDIFSNEYFDDGGGLIVEGTKTYFCGDVSNGFPTTNGTAGNNTTSGTDIGVLVIERCATDYTGSPVVTPAGQTVCQNGLISEIKVDHYMVPGVNLPILTSNGGPYFQPDIYASYQWQKSPASSGPWTDIPGANNRNYTPAPLITTTCYRRIARNGECCGNLIIQTSNVHCITVGPDQAPIVNAGGIYNTCPGTPVTMSASVSSGTPGFFYQWAEGNSTTILSTGPTLTVSPAYIGAAVYTVTVTDSKGCRQLDQAIVNSYSANAGPDVGFCEGTPGAIIGGPAIPGVPGVIYSWSPSTGLSCTNCAQPTATPTFPTTYTLTLTIPVTGGTTCSTTDQVTVTPTNRPVNNFAGPDRVICFGNTTTIGLPAQNGFTYTWSPGAYITSNITTPTTFDHGDTQFPTPNPITYQLTAQRNGCTWFDDVEVAVIKAKAYPGNLDPFCGPRFVGEGDFTPNINETWQWTQLSGDGMFTGPTNIPVTTVSASVNQTSQYQLTVSYNGTTCTDVATVPVCSGPPGGGCGVDIFVGGGIGCPSYGSYGVVWLIAYGGISGAPGPYDFSWSPAAGLSTTTGDSVMLTDNVPRTYTVTISHPLTNTTCTETISVNNPAWSRPNFTAQDPVICPGQSTFIGAPPVNGYSYEWTPPTNLSNPLISNPLASNINTTTYYYVSVVDIVSGCTALDTAKISVVPTLAIAGPDQVLCDNSVITIGAPPAPNTSYSWTPAGANWQNGTNQFSSQPEVLIAITTTFILTATNSQTGCTDKDTVVVSVGSPVTPFTLSDIQYCPSSASIQLGGGVPFGYSYSWSPTNNMNNPNAMNPIVSPPPNGQTTYTLIITNATGCSFATTQTVIPRVPKPLVAPTQVLCVGETANIGSNNNPTGYFYSWSPSIGLSNPTSPNPVFTATTTGTFVYTLTVSQSGCSNSASVVINVLDFSLNLPPKTVCDGGCVRIGTTAIPGATYNWSPTTGLDDPTSSNPLACVTGNIVYTLTAVSPNGCQAIVTVPVYTNPDPAPEIMIPTVNACIGTTGNTINPVVTPPGSYNYSWTPNNGTLIYPTSSAPEVVITGLGTYTYNVTVTNAISGCASEAAVDVIVTSCDSECNLQVSAATTNLVCHNDNSGAINLTVSNSSLPNTYIWSNGAVVEDPSGLAAGSYSVTITDADGCDITTTVTLTEPTELLCATSVLSNVTVNGGSDGSALSVGNGGTPGYTYEWSDGQTTPIATGLTAGTYSVSIYDDNKCLEVCSTTIMEPPAQCPDLTPTLTILPGNISGLSPLEVAVEVSELNDVDTDGTIITVRMPSDPRVMFVWNIGLTQAAFIPVQNPDWNYLGDNGIFHSWTYNGPGLIINGLQTSAFGFQAFYDPQGTDGSTTLTATIVPFSGGECTITNNTDAERLIYFD